MPNLAGHLVLTVEIDSRSALAVTLDLENRAVPLFVDEPCQSRALRHSEIRAAIFLAPKQRKRNSALLCSTTTIPVNHPNSRLTDCISANEMFTVSSPTWTASLTRF